MLLRWLCVHAVLRRDDRRRNPRPYNTAYRVVVSGLPTTASWQDLKDHMRKGGEVTFAQVGRRPLGGGVGGVLPLCCTGL